MEKPSGSSPKPKSNNPHPPYLAEISSHGLRSELESLSRSYHSVKWNSMATKETLSPLQQRMNEFVNHNARLGTEITQITGERDSLRDKLRYFETGLKLKDEEFSKKLDEKLGEKEGLKKDVEDFEEGVQKLESEREQRNGFMLKSLDSLNLMKECLSRVIKGLGEEKDEIGVKERESFCVESEICEEFRVLLEEVRLVSRLAMEVESRVEKYKELRKKEKRELENSLVSLTEESRDINKLLRIALLQKEAAEKRLKDHKRVAQWHFCSLQSVDYKKLALDS